MLCYHAKYDSNFKIRHVRPVNSESTQPNLIVPCALHVNE